MQKAIDLKNWIVEKSDLIACVLFIVSIIFYAIGDPQVLGHFKAQGYLQIGAAIFIICNFKKFSIEDVKFLSFPFFCFLIVAFLGLLTYFDEILPSSFSTVLKSINTHIIFYFIVFVLCYLYAKYSRYAKFVIYAFILACVVNVLTTAIIGIYTGAKHTKVFYFFHVFTYNIWLLAPMAFSLAGLWIFKSKKLKLFFVLCVAITLVAMLKNGERSFLVAVFPMVFVPFIICKYRFKKVTLLALPIVIILSFFGIYEGTKNLPLRHNFAFMIDNFYEVMSLPPSQMGQHDAICFPKPEAKKKYKCANESLELGKSEVIWEHSSLARMAMSKSTFLAFLDEPFTPHLMFIFDIGKYLYQYYQIYNPQNRVYVSINENMNGYNSPHNFAVSLLFCYGIIGFLAIIFFLAFIFKNSYSSIAKTQNFTRFLSLSLCIFIIGICTQSVFDAIYPIILQSIFIMFGLIIGFIKRA